MPGTCVDVELDLVPMGGGTAVCARGVVRLAKAGIANAAAQKIAITPMRTFPQDALIHSLPRRDGRQATNCAAQVKLFRNFRA
jgi:hypothetical protein